MSQSVELLKENLLEQHVDENPAQTSILAADSCSLQPLESSEDTPNYMINITDFFQQPLTWEGAFKESVTEPVQVVHYRDDEVSFEVPSVTTPLQSDLPLASNTLNSSNSDAYILNVKRNDCLSDMLDAFMDNSIISCTSVVVNTLLPNDEKEKGSRESVLADCQTGFWQEFYEKCTLGADSKVPYLRHDFNDLKWQACPLILLFGWKRCEYLPTELSKVFVLAACGMMPDTATSAGFSTIFRIL